MKIFCKKILVLIAIIAATFTTTSLTTPSSAAAADFSCRYFAGLTSWDCHVGDINSQEALVSNIATIATNILTDVSVIASYLIIGYVMYGGYLYMFSSGDPGKAAAGKKTLTHAFIGLAIAMSAYAIFSGIRIALIGNNNLGNCNPLEQACVDGNTMIVNLIQWIGGMGGVVAAIFIVVGGWGYITAGGDPGKLQKAKNTILYALIGLVIVALTEVLTAFISNLIRESNTFNGSIETTQVIANINKENLS